MVISPASTNCEVGHDRRIGYILDEPSALCTLILYGVSCSIETEERVLHTYPVEVEAHPTPNDGQFLADHLYAYNVEQTGV